jgi:hypothetical protein
MIVDNPIADIAPLATLLQLAGLSVLECRSGADALNAALSSLQTPYCWLSHWNPILPDWTRAGSSVSIRG